MPKHIVFIDIDGLRRDVFNAALQAGRLPHIARLFGGRKLRRGLQIPMLAPAPSITFCSQASLFTGAHPKDHGIPGNQFFDRFGAHSEGLPAYYAFDVGDTLAVDDAVRVFTDGLAANCLQVPTFYEKMRPHGRRAVVAGHMYAAGAAAWLTPSLTKLGRFTKGGNLFGMSSAEYDGHILNKTLTHIENNGLPDILTVYFMGVDHDSHKYGPQKQGEALQQIDPLIGKLWDAVLTHAQGAVFVALFSDHGQIGVIPEDRHSLKIGFPFDREMGYFFDALDLDVHDYPGEDPNCDAVMALNGGLASVYLHNKVGHWWDEPAFERDVLPIGRAFWEAHQTGQYAPDLRGALAGVLIRNVAREGWEAPYEALTPSGKIVPLEEWFDDQPDHLYVDTINRLNNYTNKFSGDLLLISNYAEKYYFGGEQSGIHGGLHPEEAQATLVYGWTGVSPQEWQRAKAAIESAIDGRCQRENRRQPSVTDMLVGVEAVLSLPE